MDEGKVRFPALRVEYLDQVSSMGSSLPVVAPTRTPGANASYREVALPLADVLEIALDHLRNQRIDELRAAESTQELLGLLGL